MRRAGSLVRYNGFPAADVIGESDPRQASSSEAIAKITELAKTVLPPGMEFEWTDLSYQQVTQGNASLIVFPLAVLLVFLVLAALYESWSLPLAIILIVPICLLCALFGVWLTGGDNNVFVQNGLVVLIGLACKNSIPIIEFARELELKGYKIVLAALEACRLRLRLRPIIMTSIAFCAGVGPLVIASGAGAELRHAMGVTGGHARCDGLRSSVNARVLRCAAPACERGCARTALSRHIAFGGLGGRSCTSSQLTGGLTFNLMLLPSYI